ncbi:SDR family oxidoreductase [uncultured Brachyspira sp.]|uniref:SDR family oxidoreductase n=1 Tax=uncultured Brachyspira sp. TaxID=221953 RepID=UPI00345C2BE5
MPYSINIKKKRNNGKTKFKNSISVSADVTNLEEIKNAVKIAEEKYGKTDLLINCAGVMLLGNIDKQSYEEWKNMIDVNVNGILTTTNVILPDMIKRNEGTIINISSIAGRKTFTNHGIYCGSKFAVHAITESIREEVADKNVRIIVIAPGVVETNLLSHTTDENIKSDYIEWKKSIGNGLNASDVVNCIEFAYNMPQDICVREIVIAKTKQVD